MNFVRKISLIFVCLFLATVCFAQAVAEATPHIQKRYNIFFRINSPQIDSTFKTNARTISQLRSDLETTLAVDGTAPESIMILASASPDGPLAFNRQLAMNRAESAKNLLVGMFPQLDGADIRVEYIEEDWDGLLQVLKVHTDIPQRDEMLVALQDPDNVSKKRRLKSLNAGWEKFVDEYVYALRNASITMKVVQTATNSRDEFVREPAPTIEPVNYSYTPTFPQLQNGTILVPEKDPVKFKKTILAARTNLLLPGMSVGIEIPIQEHWSVGFDYYYPWFVSSGNKWCVEMLGWFVDAKYWFTNDKTRWTPDSKLKGHGVGVYAGTGYYDFQNKTEGAQGEYINFGVDYTYALPVANDKLRLEFNIGLGFLKTWYRPYTPSSDYSDLIKEPGVKYRTTNFLAPTMAGVKLVWPITVTVKKSPYINMAKREQRSAERKANRAGGVK